MYEAVFRVAGDSAYEAATAATDTSIELWCNDHCDLLVVSGDRDARVVAEVEETVGIGQQLDQATTRTLITEACLKDRMDDNIERYVRRHGCLLIPPLKYIAGEKRARVLALDGDSLSACYEDLTTEFDVQVETKGSIRSIRPDSPFLPISALLPEFTDRQREVFQTAYEAGYYERPRETSTAAIADELGIHRRTAETHLRVAERKLVEAFAEYL
ncbi:MAG: helix-turn-helix domain-containing protein [Halobacteriales archaeon]